MSNKLAEYLYHGNARLEFIFHVAGMPWAVATSQTVIDALTTTHRERMFGDETYNSGASKYSDSVDVWPLLQMPGEQSIKNEDAMAELSGGNWTIEIADIPPGQSQFRAAFNTRAVTGLEGLQAIANPRIDKSIRTARIHAPCARGDSTIDWYQDPGMLLHTAASSASDAAPLLVWVGGECMSLIGSSAVSDVATATIGSRGLLRTKECYHATNKLTAGAPNTRVADAPIHGIANRPCYLWAFVMYDTSPTNIAYGPAKFRHGRVSSDIGFDGKNWTVECQPWWKWLDTDLSVSRVECSMAKFTVTRPGSNSYMYAEAPGGSKWKTTHPAHVIFREWDDSLSTMSDAIDVWLCDPGESVTYDTVEELEDALCDAMTTASAASGNSWTYVRRDNGPGAKIDAGDMYLITGHLPYILGWGDISRDGLYDASENPNGFSSDLDVEYTNKLYYQDLQRNFCFAWPYATTFSEGSIVGGNWYDDYSLGNGIGKWLGYDDTSWDREDDRNAVYQKRPKYIIGFGFEQTDYADTHTQQEHVNKFVIPRYDNLGTLESRVWVNTAYNVAYIGAGTRIMVGDSTTPVNFYYNSKSYLVSDSVGSGPTAENYIIADDYYQSESGNPCIRGYNGTGKFVYGQPLFAYGDGDPWKLTQSFDIFFDSIGTIYQAVMGQGSHADDVAQEIQVDHIPDYNTIDWAQLDDMISSGILIGSLDTHFNLRYSGQVNLWKLLVEELKLYNLTPTYEWDQDAARSSDHQYKIRFRRVDTINATTAALSNRTITDANLTSDGKVKAEHATAWQINKAVLSADYDQDTEEFGYKFTISDSSGMEATGGKVSELEIAPQITQFDGLSSTGNQANLAAYISKSFENMTDPRPEIKVSLTTRDMMSASVGAELSATIDRIHDPFDGSIGIVDWPCAYSEVAINPAKASIEASIVMSARLIYGWAPSLLITASEITDGVVHVTDIGGTGRLFCNYGNTLGWYDHWFFADIGFNNSMSVPILKSSDTYRCKLVERGVVDPTIISGVTVDNVNLGTYTDVIGAAEDFLTISGTVGYDGSKEYWLIFDEYDTALDDSQRKWVYVADDTGLLTDDAAATLPGRVWT